MTITQAVVFTSILWTIMGVILTVTIAGGGMERKVSAVERAIACMDRIKEPQNCHYLILGDLQDKK